MNEAHDETTENDHDHGHADGDHDHDHDHGDHDHGDVEHEAKVEQAGARVTMEITVAAEEVAENVEAVAQVFRQRAKIEGFRPGKAPMGMVKQRFREEIRENVLDQMIPLHTGHEIKDRGLKPIHNPMLDNVDFQLGAPLTFKVFFDVAPDLSVSGYKDLKATKTVRPIGDDAVEQAVTKMREQAAKLEPVDEGNAIEPGDYVIAAITLLPREGKGKKLAEEERFVHVGEEYSIPSLNDQLPGLARGDKREFVTELAASYPDDLLAGKEVTCKVEVQEIKRRHLPEVDDDMARDLGFADLDELRQKTQENYQSHMEEEADRDVARQLIDHVIEANEFDTPESLVDSRLEHSMQRAAQDIARQGVDPRNAVDWENFQKENRPHAARAVSEEILLDAIARAEEITVDDADVVAEIDSHQEGQPDGASTRIAQQMRQDGSFDGLRLAMVRRRALEFVKSHATIETVEASAEPAAD